MVKPRTFHEPVILVPGPASFNSPQLRAAIATPRAATSAPERPRRDPPPAVDDPNTI